MRIPLLLLLVLVVLSNPSLARGEELPQEISPAEAAMMDDESLYRLTLGVSVHSTDFDVNDTSGNIQGTLSEDAGYSPFISLGSPYRFFGEESNFGWYLETALSTFRLDRQLVGNDLVDLGTSVKGYYATITPVLYYNFGARSLAGHSFKLGVGAGAGYLQAKGDIILTRTPTQERHSFNLHELGLAVFVFTDYRYKNLMIRISGSGPSVEDGGREYDIFAFAMDFGYTFTF